MKYKELKRRLAIAEKTLKRIESWDVPKDYAQVYGAVGPESLRVAEKVWITNIASVALQFMNNKTEHKAVEKVVAANLSEILQSVFPLVTAKAMTDYMNSPASHGGYDASK